MQHSTTAQQNYLQGDVFTATPQKLQLLLVEAAIKNIYRTKQSWQEERFDVGIETLLRAQDIVSEILCSLDVEGSPDIAKRLASIYLFIFRRLAESGMTHDAEKLEDALRVLNSERETWRLVCEKFGTSQGQASSGDPTNKGASVSSAEYTPSAAASAAGSSARLDLSASAAAGQTISSSSGISTFKPTTFARPGASTFTQGMRPLGASPIQTSGDLAKPKQSDELTTAATQSGSPMKSGIYPAASQSGKTAPSTPVASSGSSGNNWEV